MRDKLEMHWELEEPPDPEQFVALVEELAPTMPEPLNRLVAHGGPALRTRACKWSPERAIELLRDGDRGESMSYLSAYRHHFGKDANNWHPEASVSLTIGDEDRLETTTLIADAHLGDEDPGERALHWAELAERHLRPHSGLAAICAIRGDSFWYAARFVNGGPEAVALALRRHAPEPEHLLATLESIQDARVDPNGSRRVAAGERIRSVRLLTMLDGTLRAAVVAALETSLGSVPGEMRTLGDRTAWIVPAETDQQRAHAVLADAGLTIERAWVPLRRPAR